MGAVNQVKVGIFVFLFLSVLSIAFPYGPLEHWEDFYQPKLAYLGIDVSNTPITADMMLMYDFGTKQPLYQFPFKLEVEGDKSVTLDWQKLGFYHLKVPTILFIDNLHYGERVRLEIRAICHSLGQWVSQPKRFRYWIPSPEKTWKNYGLNQWFDCKTLEKSP